MTESMIERGVAAIEKLVIGDHGCYSERCCCSGLAAFECKTGLSAQDVARALIEAMREPTKTQLESMEPWSRVTGHHEMVWKAGIDAALIWPAGSADRAGVPMAKD